MPIYYVLCVGGERKGGGKIRKTEDGGAKKDVNKMGVDDLKEWVWKDCDKILQHVNASQLDLYYLPSRDACIVFAGDVGEPVEFDETVDTSSSRHSISGTIYLGVTGAFVCAVPILVCLSK